MNKKSSTSRFKRLTNSQKAYAQQGQQPPPNFPPPGKTPNPQWGSLDKKNPRRGVHANAYPRQYVKPKANQKQRSLTKPDSFQAVGAEVLDFVVWFMKVIMLLGTVSVAIGGITGVVFFDLATGAVSLGSIFKYGAEITPGFTASGIMFSTAISFMTSLCQMGGWIAIEHRKKMSKSTRADKGWAVFLIFVMFVDTYFDLGVLNIIVFKQGVLTFNPFSHGVMFGMLSMMLAVFFAVGERSSPYIIKLIELLRDNWSL